MSSASASDTGSGQLHLPIHFLYSLVSFYVSIWIFIWIFSYLFMDISDLVYIIFCYHPILLPYFVYLFFYYLFHVLHYGSPDDPCVTQHVDFLIQSEQ